MIPVRFEHATLENFTYPTKSQHAALRAVTAWLTDLHNGPMLALVGSTGAGKSHLLYAAAKLLKKHLDDMDPKERAQSRRTYPYVAPWYALADQLRYGQSVQTEAGGRDLSPAEIRGKLWNNRIVMLDEVRRTSGTEFDDSELAKFACHAYDQRIAVLVTTNVNPLENVMGPAAASRFRVVEIDAPDARQMPLPTRVDPLLLGA